MENKKFNKLSVVSLILVLVGPFLILFLILLSKINIHLYILGNWAIPLISSTIILGFILSRISISQIKISGERGKFFAYTSSIISAGVIILFFFSIILSEQGRPGFENRAIKSQLASMKAQSELYYELNENYFTSTNKNLCTDDSKSNGLGSLLAATLASSKGKELKCFSDKDSWVVTSELVDKPKKDDRYYGYNYYCVDSTGGSESVTKAQNDSIINSDTLCPSSVVSKIEDKNEVKQISNFSQLENMIPENIENYTRDNNGIIGYKDRFSEERCDKNTNLKDGYCYKELSVNYSNKTDNKIIFVVFNIVTKNLDSYEERLKRLSKIDILNSYHIFRFDIFDVTWQPLSTYDLITVMEGKAVANPDDSFHYEYKEKASGTNPVTQYFINKYPPSRL